MPALAAFVRAADWLIRLVGGEELLDNRPELHTAVHLRSPYVDVLSLLQLRDDGVYFGPAHAAGPTGLLEGDDALAGQGSERFVDSVAAGAR